jgi:hypothetical protein
MNKPKNKGRRGEHKTDKFFNNTYGKDVCKRVPGSGCLPGLPGDNRLNLMQLGYRRPFQVETKNKKNPPGWASMEKILGTKNDIGVIWKTGVSEPLIIMRGSFFQELVEPTMEEE